MKAKIYISFLIVSLLSVAGFGQKFNKYCLYADYATTAYNKGKISEAIALMDSAITNCSDQNNTFENWFNLSMFYKQLAKETKDPKEKDKYRKEAFTTIITARELDEEGNYTKNINGVIKSIANYYYNDAVIKLDDTSSNFVEAVELYNEYKKVYSAIGNVDFKEKDILFYTVLGQRNSTKYENNKQLYKQYLDSAVASYKKVLEIDSNLADIHMKIGILYFNEAIDLVNALDPDADWDVAIKADERKAELALLSIPHFKKVLESDPDNTKALYSLAGCYELLTLKDEVRHYLTLLKEKDPEFYNDVYKTNP